MVSRCSQLKMNRSSLQPRRDSLRLLTTVKVSSTRLVQKTYSPQTPRFRAFSHPAPPKGTFAGSAASLSTSYTSSTSIRDGAARKMRSTLSQFQRAPGLAESASRLERPGSTSRSTSSTSMMTLLFQSTTENLGSISSSSHGTTASGSSSSPTSSSVASTPTAGSSPKVTPSLITVLSTSASHYSS